MATYLGKFAAEDRPAESAIGIFETHAGSWFAHIWRDDFGPCRDRAAAERLLSSQLDRMPNPVELPNPVFSGILNGLALEAIAAAVVFAAVFFLL